MIKSTFLHIFFFMTPFLSVLSDSDRAEFLIDIQLFSPVIAMKAAYVLLDRAYFFFFIRSDGLIVQVTPKV